MTYTLEEHLRGKYVNEEVKIRVNMEEKERGFGSYYVLLDMMTVLENLKEVSRMKKMVVENPTEIDFMVKLGIARRKLFAYFHKSSPVVVEWLIQKGFLEGSDGSECFNEAIQKDPNHIQVLYNLAVKELFSDNDEPEFLKIIKKMTEMYSDSPFLVFLQGTYIVYQKKYREGIEYLKKNMDILSQNKATLKYGIQKIWTSLSSLGDQDSEEKVGYIQLFIDKISVNRDSRLGYYEMGWYYVRKSRSSEDILMKKQNLQKAEENFLLAMNIATRNVYYCLAVINSDLYEDKIVTGEKEREETLKKILSYLDREFENDPFQKTCHLMSIEYSLKSRNFDKAMNHAETLIRIYPDSKGYRKKAKIMVEKFSYQNEDNPCPNETGLEMASVFLIQSVNCLLEDPELFKVYYKIGFLNKSLFQNTGKQEDLDRSLKYLNLALQTKENHTKSLYLRSEIYLLENRNIELCLKDLDVLEELDWEDVEFVYQMKAHIYKDLLEDNINALKFSKKYVEAIKELTDGRNDVHKVDDIYGFMDELQQMEDCYIELGLYGKLYRSLKENIPFVEGLMVDEKMFDMLCGNDKFYEIAYNDRIKRYVDEAKVKRKNLIEKHGLDELLRDKGSKRSRNDLLERLNYFASKNETKNQTVCVVSICGNTLHLYNFFVQFGLFS